MQGREPDRGVKLSVRRRVVRHGLRLRLDLQLQLRGRRPPRRIANSALQLDVRGDRRGRPLGRRLLLPRRRRRERLGARLGILRTWTTQATVTKSTRRG